MISCRLFYPAGGYINFDITFNPNQIQRGQVLELFFVRIDSGELRITPILVHPVASNSVLPDEWRFMLKLDQVSSGKWIAKRYDNKLSIPADSLNCKVHCTCQIA